MRKPVSVSEGVKLRNKPTTTRRKRKWRINKNQPEMKIKGELWSLWNSPSLIDEQLQRKL